jgi:hypothetical protein
MGHMPDRVLGHGLGRLRQQAKRCHDGGSQLREQTVMLRQTEPQRVVFFPARLPGGGFRCIRVVRTASSPWELNQDHGPSQRRNLATLRGISATLSYWKYWIYFNCCIAASGSRSCRNRSGKKSPVRGTGLWDGSGLAFEQALFGGSHDFQRLMDMLIRRQLVGRG